MKRLNAQQLRVAKPKSADLKMVKRTPLYFVLDQIIDTYNIGSLFRLADAVAVKKIYLCGQMEYPPSSRIHKAAIGTENWVPWEKIDNTLKIIQELKAKKVQIIVVEQHPNSLSYSLLSQKVSFPCAIVVGNETSGIKPKILKEANIVVELPMLGINKSFNVWGSAAVVAYKILEALKK